MDEQSRLDEVQRLFEAARETPPGEREQRLRQLCDDAELRQEALDLLTLDDDTELDGLGEVVQRALAGGAGAGESLRLEGFELGAVIGAGAMGVVYRAEQASPRRTVAVKALRAGPGSGGLARRFRSESEALGRLRHPGIATVHHAGLAQTPEGARPYLVMEFVDGVPLDTWLGATGPDVRRRLAMMADICDAVQHAHTHSVIHRDLKPSNILVTPEGSPKVIDFGVARIADPSGASMQTAAGEMVGTLAYMSPEQFSGDPGAVDTRSDVYALGVILFFMLCGELPHDVATMSLAAAARAIEQAAPKRLSAVRPELRGDIEIIVARAMEKDKQRRYQTAEALADDIRRYLAGLPINARPPSALYVLGRLARRHRPAVAAAALVAAALLAAAVISSRNAVIAQQALAESQKAEKRVQEINDFLIVDLLRAGHSQVGGADTRVIDVVDRAIPVIDDRFAGDPLGAAKVRRILAELLLEAGRADEALEQIELGLAALDQSDRASAREVMSLLMTRVRLRTTIGQPDLAEVDARAGLRLADELRLGPDDIARLEVLGGLGAALQSQGHYAEAEALLREAIAGVRRNGPPYPFLLGLYTHLYQAIRQQGAGPDQLAAIGWTIVELAEANGDPSGLMLASSLRATMLEQAGDLEGAVAARMQAVKVVKASTEPLSPMHRVALAQAADTLAHAGRPEEGIPLMLEAHDLFVAALGPHHYDVERAAGWLAQLHEQAGQMEQSKRWRQRNLVLRYYIAGPDELESLLMVAAHGAELLGSDEAFTQALLAEAESLGPDDPARPPLLANLGRVLAERDDPRAEALLAEAVASLDLADSARRPQDVVARVRAALPAYLQRAGRAAEAAAWEGRLDVLARSARPGR